MYRQAQAPALCVTNVKVTKEMMVKRRDSDKKEWFQLQNQGLDHCLISLSDQSLK
jgi:hypothetical protein